jgi:hypothetical protein
VNRSSAGAVRGKVRMEEPAMADDRYVVMTVGCQNCKTKQRVHVAARTGFAQIGDRTIQCLRSDDHFKVTVPDRIVGGPFPA